MSVSYVMQPSTLQMFGRLISEINDERLAEEWRKVAEKVAKYSTGENLPVGLLARTEELTKKLMSEEPQSIDLLREIFHESKDVIPELKRAATEGQKDAYVEGVKDGVKGSALVGLGIFAVIAVAAGIILESG